MKRRVWRRTVAVRNLVFQGGERLPLPLSAEGLGNGELTYYLLSRLREEGLQASTLEKKVRSLQVFEIWCRDHAVDIQKRARDFSFLSSAEILGLKAFLQLPASAARKSAKVLPRGKIGPATAQERMQTIADYLCWLGEESLLGRGSSKAARYLAGERKLSAFKRKVKRVGKFRLGTHTETRLGLLPEQRELLLQIIQPGSPENPFHVSHQHRNFALMALYFEFGLRLAEPLTLRLVGTHGRRATVDLAGSYSREHGADINAPSICIVRNHDDPGDVRVKQPVVKTQGRLLFFSEGGIAFNAVKAWVEKHRPDRDRYPGAKRSPFLFISRKTFFDRRGREVAAPLSVRRASEIVAAIANSNPALESLTPHVLRHDWNDRWNELLAEKGFEWEECVREQEYAMGWSAHSSMPSVYGRRSIQRQTNELSLDLQRASLRLNTNSSFQ